MQANILQIWMARNFNIRQWAMLHCRGVHPLMREYSINHITCSPHHPQSNGLAEKYVQIAKSLFYKVKEEGKDLFKCLMVYHNTPLSSSLQSLIQILSSRSARSDLPVSNTARKQLGLDCADLRNKYKNEHLPLHDLHLDQEVMYQDSTSKQVYAATITRPCKEPRSYVVKTRGCPVEKYTSSLETISTPGQEE